jgi:hypothetical protein
MIFHTSMLKEPLMKRTFCVAAVAFLAVLGFGLAAAQAEIWNAVTDFSATANPSHDWSYGYCEAGAGPAGFTPYNHTAPLPGYESSGVVGWCFGDAGWADPNLNKNTSETLVDAYTITWEPGTLAGGGDGGGAYATMLRWTCPADGVYDVDATLTGIQNSGAWANWLVSKNASTDWLAIQMYGGYGESLAYSDQLTLSAGDTLDFLSHGMQHTAFSATIESVPEPGTLSLISSSLLGAVFFAWRKRK